VLAHPDWSRTFYVTTDASKAGIGACLEQPDDQGHLRPVAFYSRTFNDAEARSSPHEQELIAAADAIRHWDCYLRAKPFHLFTDSGPTVHIVRSKTTRGRFFAALLALQSYTFTVRHVSGKANVVADALSRTPQVPAGGTPSQHYLQAIEDSVAAHAPLTMAAVRALHPPLPAPLPVTDAEWATAQSTDPFCRAWGEYLRTSTPPEAIPAAWRATMKPGHAYAISADVLRKRVDAGLHSAECIIVPAKLRATVLRAAHDGALASHIGARGTLDNIKRSWWWPGVDRDAHTYTRSCPECQLYKSTDAQHHGLLRTKHSTARFAGIAFDLWGPAPPDEDTGALYVLTIIEEATGWVSFVPIRSATAEDIAGALFREWCCMFGPPATVTSDQGPQFRSTLMQELLKLLGVRQHLVTPYRPQANGVVERVHRVLRTAVGTTKLSDTRWARRLPAAQYAIRTLPRPSGITPYELTFGSRAPPLKAAARPNGPTATMQSFFTK